MAEYEFIAPEFLTDYDSDTIHARMMDTLPPDIDDMPGGFPWDFTYPSALEIDRFANDALVRVLMNMFVQYAEGEFLNLHGGAESIERRPARAATSVLKVVGDIGVEIPEGTVFCTVATEDTPSILFSADEYHQIKSGVEYVRVTAVEMGTSSNTMADTIILLQDPIEGIREITNPDAVTDGIDEEDDDTFRDRIIAACRTEISHVGNPADYVRWAFEIAEVGKAICVPEWDGPGTVELIVYDTNGQPASQSILDEVYNHIANTPESLLRLAPVGATLTVKAPRIIEISITGVLEINVKFVEVRDRIVTNLTNYISSKAIEDEVIRYSQCFAIVKDTDGVVDLSSFYINGEASNIPVTKEEFPKICEVHFTGPGIVESDPDDSESGNSKKTDQSGEDDVETPEEGSTDEPGSTETGKEGEDGA